jgi:hypothetical protein
MLPIRKDREPLRRRNRPQNPSRNRPPNRPPEPEPEPVPEPVPEPDPLDNCLAGVIDACIEVLDTLDEKCLAGDPLSCDLLYLASPTDSAYWWDGGTCGWYFEDLSYAGFCSET